mgnify:CR=1 FL=1
MGVEGVGALSYGFSKFRITESPRILVLELVISCLPDPLRLLQVCVLNVEQFLAEHGMDGHHQFDDVSDSILAIPSHEQVTRNQCYVCE